jgi:hypothetical protein
VAFLDIDKSIRVLPPYLVGNNNYPKHTIFISNNLQEALFSYRAKGIIQTLKSIFPYISFETLVTATYSSLIPKNLNDMIDPLRIAVFNIFIKEYDDNTIIKMLIKTFKTFARQLNSNNMIKNYMRYISIYFNSFQPDVGSTEKLPLVMVAWSNVLLEAATYICPFKIIYGFDNADMPMSIDEICPNFDSTLFHINRHGKYSVLEDKNLWLKNLESCGYKFDSYNDFLEYVALEKNYTSILLSLAYYINSDNQSILQIPFGNRIHNCYQFKNLESHFSYWKSDIDRTYTLPKNGVHIAVKNFGDIVELRLAEVYDDALGFILIFCMTLCDITNIIGEYVVDSHKLTLSLDDSIVESVKSAFSLVYAAYIHLISKDFTDECIKFVSSFDTLVYQKNIVYLKVLDHSESGKTHKFLSDYSTEKRSIEADIRRLPIGQIASLEAKHNAMLYGVTLPEGYTFVREFTKHVRVSDTKNQ